MIADEEVCWFQQSLEQTVEMLKGVKRIPTLTPQDSQAIARFYQGLKYRTGKTLASLQVLALNISATNYCQMLQEIAEEQKFDVTYVDIQHLSFNGMYKISNLYDNSLKKCKM